MNKSLLEVKHLVKTYPIYGTLGKLFPPKMLMHAVADLSFQILEGEIYGLVGESGCGKTTTGRMITGLTKPDAGEIFFRGKELLTLTEKEKRKVQNDIRLVFQDSLSSFSPRHRIGKQLEEPLIIQKSGTPEERKKRAFEILDKVGLPEELFFRYPHELSGGQVQRLGIARALIVEPKLVVCDEPVSALDVSVRAQVLNMLLRLQTQLQLSLLFISHDIGVVRHISNRIGVMYLGSLVEEATTEELFTNTLHPYTKALFQAVPSITKKRKQTNRLTVELPVRTNKLQGCAFRTRCPHATDICQRLEPQLKEAADGHKVACHLV